MNEIVIEIKGGLICSMEGVQLSSPLKITVKDHDCGEEDEYVLTPVGDELAKEWYVDDNLIELRTCLIPDFESEAMALVDKIRGAS